MPVEEANNMPFDLKSIPLLNSGEKRIKITARIINSTKTSKNKADCREIDFVDCFLNKNVKEKKKALAIEKIIYVILFL